MAATILASKVGPNPLIAPDYGTRVSAGTRAAEDTVGPLPEVKLYIPKGGFQQPKNGLPINPSPRISQETWTRSPPLASNSFQSSPASTHTSASSQTSEGDALLPRDGADKQTQTSMDDSLDCHYCRGCQRRLRARSDTAGSTSSTNSLPHDDETVAPPMASLPKRSATIGRRLKLGVLQRPGSKLLKNRNANGGGEADGGKAGEKMRERLDTKAARRMTRKIDYETISPTDHWANE